MFYRAMVILIFLAALTMFQGVSAEVDIRNGMWEITTKMDMPGMPMEMPAVKFTQCLTRENSVPQNNNQSGDCKITQSQVKGSTVVWEMQCVSQGKTMKGSGKVTYSGDTFTGGMTMESDGINMTQHMSGRYIGECKGK